MMESRLISALRKSRIIFTQISLNSRVQKSGIFISNEPSLLIHSKIFSSSSSKLVPATQNSIVRKLCNWGFRAFCHHYPDHKLDQRILATATLAAIGCLWVSTRKLELHPAIRSLIGSIVGMAALQVTLGVSTLLSFPWHSSSSRSSNAFSFDASSHHTLRQPSLSLLQTLPPVAKTVI